MSESPALSDILREIVHYGTFGADSVYERAVLEAADEIERLRDIVCEYELREAENTLTPEEAEAILALPVWTKNTPKIPDVDTGADGNNNQAKDKQ